MHVSIRGNGYLLSACHSQVSRFGEGLGDFSQVKGSSTATMTVRPAPSAHTGPFIPTALPSGGGSHPILNYGE